MATKTRKTVKTSAKPVQVAPQQPVQVQPEAREVHYLATKDGTERYERMSAAEVARKNDRRKVLHLDGQWELAEVVPAGTTVYDKELLIVGEARKQAFLAGYAKDAEMAEAAAARRAKVQPEAEVKAEEAEEAKTVSKSGGTARLTWHELGMCDFLRYCGSRGFDKKTSTDLAVKAGFKPSPTTVSIQTKKGRDGESVPQIAAEHLAELGLPMAKKAKKAKK